MLLFAYTLFYYYRDVLEITVQLEMLVFLEQMDHLDLLVHQVQMDVMERRDTLVQEDLPDHL